MKHKGTLDTDDALRGYEGSLAKLVVVQIRFPGIGGCLGG